MGQQQLLLIMLGVIVVGVAIAVGVLLFKANAIEQKRNEVLNECTILASEAQLYFKRPTTYGGGNKSFIGWEIPSQYKTTEAGSFKATVVSANEVIITGTGNEVVTGNDSVQVQLTVTPLTYQATIIK